MNLLGLSMNVLGSNAFIWKIKYHSAKVNEFHRRTIIYFFEIVLLFTHYCCLTDIEYHHYISKRKKGPDKNPALINPISYEKPKQR